MHRLRTPFQAVYDAPQWLDQNGNDVVTDTGDHANPISYLRSIPVNPNVPTDPGSPSKITVTPKFTVTGTLSGSYEIIGAGTGLSAGLTFDKTIVANGGTLLTTDITSAEALSTKIDYGDLTIAWTIKRLTNGAVVTYGSSKDRAYVTGVAAANQFDTVLFLGCSKAKGDEPPESWQADADRATANQAIITAVFGAFSSANVQRVDGTALAYYRSYSTGNLTTATLLAGGQGQCGSFASLLIDTLRTQGAFGIQYEILEPNNGAKGFIVKSWDFRGAGHSGDASYPYVNVIPTGGNYVNATDDGYVWGMTSPPAEFADVTDATGIAGQGNSNPASFFENHQVVKITDSSGTKYFDPSYGTQFASLAAIDDAAIAGYYKRTTLLLNEAALDADLDGDGLKTHDVSRSVFIFMKNPAGNDLKETVWPY